MVTMLMGLHERPNEGGAGLLDGEVGLFGSWHGDSIPQGVLTASCGGSSYGFVSA